jgi:hypothetical protein
MGRKLVKTNVGFLATWEKKGVKQTTNQFCFLDLLPTCVCICLFFSKLYELTTNEIPYCDKNALQMKNAIENKKLPLIPNQNQIHPILLKLIDQCWNLEPKTTLIFRNYSPINAISQAPLTQTNTQKETISK